MGQDSLLCYLVLPKPRRAALRRRGWALAGGVAAIVGGGLYWEMQTSALQARSFTYLAQALRYEVGPGAAPVPPLAQAGPYDERLGYKRLRQFITRLAGQRFEVESQARVSPLMQNASGFGLFPIYKEKVQAGLVILGCDGGVVSESAFPHDVYPGFAAVPPLVVRSLLFIENRELLDPRYPHRNPAVEWDRLGHAALLRMARMLMPGGRAPGGSTLATQIEKYRHSPGGRTESMSEKLRQMTSASLRAYLSGDDTLAARQQIVVDYLNTMPLSATPLTGEVFGLGDGLWAWYGARFDRVNDLLRREPSSLDELAVQGRMYRQALSLLVAQRRPSALLGSERQRLAELTDTYLRLLAHEGVISERLLSAALTARSLPATTPGGLATLDTERKVADTVRARLSGLLGTGGLYDLERLDLTVETPLRSQLQAAVTQVLKRLGTPAGARDAGLHEARLLDRGDPAGVIYSFILLERTAQGNLVRVQADSIDQPFDVNEQSKLDLGSTAKLRTLVTYLEMVAEMHARYAQLPPDALRWVKVSVQDRLTTWAVDYLMHTEDHSLEAMLEAAMARRYSASPGETFFTGGGAHRFANFHREDDGRVVSVSEAFRHSINLPFVRLMRDVVQHQMLGTIGAAAAASGLQRMQYLTTFADGEGQGFVKRFYVKYRGETPDAVLDTLAHGMRRTPARLAAAFRYVAPQADVAALDAFLARQLPKGMARDATALYERYAPGRFSLNDQAFLARVHPLELWTAEALYREPGLRLGDLLKASREVRLASYDWLFRTRNARAQEHRISTVREAEAFKAIHQRWARLGYPFDTLVPSYATAIGSSADRPAALAELMGILVSDGVRMPTVRIGALHFAANTPYETRMVPSPPHAQQVLAPAVARVVRRALTDVVENGTAKRLGPTLALRNGALLTIGGKTGTGDNRFETYGPGGALTGSRVVSRAATFVFMIGERYFGTVTAYVPGENAARYDFTSALSVQVLKAVKPVLARELAVPCGPAAAARKMTQGPGPGVADELPAPG